METLFTLALVYYLVWFANFCIEIVQWSGVTKNWITNKFFCKIFFRLVLNWVYIEYVLRWCHPSGECLRGKGPPDRILAKPWRRLFLAAYTLWAKSRCCCCGVWQSVCRVIIIISDYHSRIKRAASSRSSAIINFDAINRRQFFCATCNWHEKLAPESVVEFMARVSGARVRGLWHVNTFYCATGCNATHGIAKAFLSCLSVCSSVCQTGGLWQNERNLYPHSYTTLKIIHPSFLTRRMVGGGNPFYLKFWAKLSLLQRKRQFWIGVRL